MLKRHASGEGIMSIRSVASRLVCGRYCRSIAVGVLVCVLSTIAVEAASACTNTTVPSGNITYAYDVNGRLTGVVNPSGRAATYAYDAVRQCDLDRKSDGGGDAARRLAQQHDLRDHLRHRFQLNPFAEYRHLQRLLDDGRFLHADHDSYYHFGLVLFADLQCAGQRNLAERLGQQPLHARLVGCNIEIGIGGNPSP